ncbi:gamma-DL-glutamyl hydrolase [Abditibacteriota bacterium]|nr:gamma-DL-glutamyl hydrolase [Abditibacteriota bacterium]
MFSFKVGPLRALPLRLSLPLFVAVPCIGVASPARADAPVVGVQAWTSGSQTFVRVRPSPLTPPVAKVASNTPLYVWGRFNDWYRVETHDHIFGWVHRQYIKSPRLYKVKVISHFKAKQASDKGSSQTMYGTVAELKAYHAQYGGSGAVRGLALKGIYIDPNRKKPAPVLMARNPQMAPRVPVSPPQTSNFAVSEDRRAALVLGQATDSMAPSASSLAGAVRSWNPGNSSPSVIATPPVVTPPSTIGQALGAASNRIERGMSPVTSIAPLPQTFANSAPPVQPRPVPSIIAPLLNTPVVSAPPIQTGSSSRPLAPVLPNNNMLMVGAPAPRTPVSVQPAPKKPVAKAASKALTAEQLHIIAWQKRKHAKEQQWLWAQAKKANDWKWRQAQAKKRAIAAQNRRLWLAKQRENRAIYLSSLKANQRANLAASVGLAPKKMPVNLPGATVAPISPDELMKAREQFLQKSSAQNVKQNTPLSIPAGTAPSAPGLPAPDPSGDLKGNLNVLLFGTADQKMQAATDLSALGAASESNESSGQATSNPAGAITPSSMPVPIATPAAAQSRVAVTNVAPMPSRGGSPRDRQMMAFNAGVANQALSYRGMPYIFGAASPSRGFDCSGLVYFLLRQRGLNPPRTASGYRTYGKPVARGQWQTGDLILFANTYKRGISHIGVYLKDGKFIHAASSSKGVRVDSLSTAYYASKYWGARRIK